MVLGHGSGVTSSAGGWLLTKVVCCAVAVCGGCTAGGPGVSCWGCATVGWSAGGWSEVLCCGPVIGCGGCTTGCPEICCGRGAHPIRTVAMALPRIRKTIVFMGILITVTFYRLQF